MAKYTIERYHRPTLTIEARSIDFRSGFAVFSDEIRSAETVTKSLVAAVPLSSILSILGEQAGGAQLTEPAGTS